ncbi:UvrD-helicase domain-containing protein [Nocardia cyriacigeorgica]|uniref:UvrD-helicase domain-containing protein n=1 Tax=Nocardia cyriacigeorgica TaxID=135487 RepID=UPI001895775A|nr:UvrD-helicase domain-containing protein [Nocardia cyriacigeorgica]MBF6455571.1 UvrD-helicase domain-containing protein [Nocardia cyriacigeorgica]MBF6553687.1 UvrD-helicase domain-containing protein [Nocardia cyriacigeorgica]
MTNSDSRRTRVYQTLRQIPDLTPRHRNFLSVPLIDDAWHVLLHRDLPHHPANEAAAIVVGSRGVHLLIFVEPGRRFHRTDDIARTARPFVAGLHNDRHYLVAQRMRTILLLPDGVAVAGSGRDIPTRPADFAATLSRLDRDFSPARARAIADEIESRAASNYRRIRIEAPEPNPTESALLDRSELVAQQRARAANRPLDEWTTFRDPELIDLINRTFGGPARISGPAGTGKTVVALHRMARHLRHNSGPVLYTTFVTTLAACQRTYFRRLAPVVRDRAEFAGLHAWARQLIDNRGGHIEIEPTRTDDAFQQAWRHAGTTLAAIDARADYWRTEIDRVIKGRGIPDLPHYWEHDRTGRSGPDLNRDQRELVWNELYLPYCDILRRQRLGDFNDMITLALEMLTEKPYEKPYGMVVVDEIQDITLNGLRLAHAIAGGGADAPLLLVGDGQQQVYEGGCRPADAGIDVRGRTAVLRVNYRNREAVYRRAVTVNAVNALGRFDGLPGCALNEARFVLPGGATVDWQGSVDELDAALLAAIRRRSAPLGELAVITTTRQLAATVVDGLRKAGIGATALEDYRGERTDKIKVGTVHRAKGLEFRGIFYVTEPPRPLTPGSPGADRQRAELWDRQTMVAITRARDFAWVGFLARTPDRRDHGWDRVNRATTIG